MFKSLLAVLVLSFAMMSSAMATGHWTIIGGVILTGNNIGTAIYQPIDTNTNRVFYTQIACETAINDFVKAKLMRGTTTNAGAWPVGTDYKTTFDAIPVTKTVAAACVLQ